jgi:CLIP-associating protein 1/2
LIRDNKGLFTDEKFDALLIGLFEYLEAPLSNMTVEKAQDVKAQILATVKLLLKKNRESFQPHVSRGLESLLATRAAYDARTHIVAGLELLSDELAALGDASEMVMTLTKKLNAAAATNPPPGTATPPRQSSDGKSNNASSSSARTLSMGMHILREIVDSRPATFVPSESELSQLCQLAAACLDSADSAVRMDAVQLCVAVHARVGDPALWKALGPGVKDDPKSLIMYYVAKRQREKGAA